MNRPQSRALSGDVLDPAPQAPKGKKRSHHEIRLATPDQMRLELSRVYREMRSGRLDPATGTKLAFVLGELRKLYEVDVIERRIEALEGPPP
jgi:hypothetical protein